MLMWWLLACTGMDEFEARSMLLMASTNPGDYCVINTKNNDHIVFVCDGEGDAIELYIQGKYIKHCITSQPVFQNGAKIWM